MTRKEILNYINTNKTNNVNKFFDFLGIDYRFIMNRWSVSSKMKNTNYKLLPGNIKYIDLGQLVDLNIDTISNWMKNDLESNKVYGVEFMLSTVEYNKYVDVEDDYYKNIGIVRNVTPHLLITNLVHPGEIYSRILLGKRALMHEYHSILGPDAYVWIRLEYLGINDESFNNKIINLEDINITNQNIDILNQLYNIDLLPNNQDYDNIGKPIEYNDIKSMINPTPLQKGNYYDLGDYIVFVRSRRSKGYKELSIFKNGYKILTINDYLPNKNNEFIRYIKELNLELIISNNKIISFNKVLQSSPLNKSYKAKINTQKISTFDIECYLDDNSYFVPYSCGFLNSFNKSKLYYLTDYKNHIDMLESCIKDMIDSKLGYVYCHNLSKFDRYFFIELFTRKDSIFDIDMKMNNNNQILYMKINYKDNKKSYIILKDSLLMLNSSLKDLSYKYNIETPKSFFPYSFVNKNNLLYKGDKPNISYYNNIDINIYNNISNNWSMRDETLKYLLTDLIALQQIMIKFSKEIYDTEKVLISKSPTLNSLAFKIFKTNYMSDNYPLHNIRGSIYNDIRKGFYGGISEVYNTKVNKQIFVYDINSSYPSSMLSDMPYGPAILSNDKNLDNYFGVVYANIKTPSINNEYIDIKYPPLPLRTNDGLINPIGTWKGMYSSELLKWVRDNYNYEIEILYGYKFKKSNKIFKKFIEKYYQLKSNNNSILNNNTAKLIMNSLYGRLGLNIIEEIITIINKKDLKELMKKYKINHIMDINDEYSKVKYMNMPSQLSNDYKSNNEIIPQINSEQSIPAALTISAKSIIKLFEIVKWINDNGGTVYYIDTDSIHTDIELPDKLIGKNIGEWKLEFISNKDELAYYPSTKFYYLKGWETKEDMINNKPMVELKRARGANADLLTKEIYEQLVENININIPITKWIPDERLSTLQVRNIDMKMDLDFYKRIINEDYTTKSKIIN